MTPFPSVDNLVDIGHSITDGLFGLLNIDSRQPAHYGSDSSVYKIDVPGFGHLACKVYDQPNASGINYWTLRTYQEITVEAGSYLKEIKSFCVGQHHVELAVNPVILVGSVKTAKGIYPVSLSRYIPNPPLSWYLTNHCPDELDARLIQDINPSKMNQIKNDLRKISAWANAMRPTWQINLIPTNIKPQHLTDDTCRFMVTDVRSFTSGKSLFH